MRNVTTATRGHAFGYDPHPIGHIHPFTSRSLARADGHPLVSSGGTAIGPLHVHANTCCERPNSLSPSHLSRYEYERRY